MYQNKEGGYVEVRRCKKDGCGKLFVPYKSNQYYCCPGHYVKIVIKQSKYPSWKCPECGYVIELNYHPKSAPKKFSEQKCCKCGYSVESDYQEIEEMNRMFRLEGIEDDEVYS